MKTGREATAAGSGSRSQSKREQSCWSEIAGSCQALETGRAGRATGARPASTERISSPVAGFTT